MERADIKLAIDMLHGAELASTTDEYVIFNAVNVLENCGNEIASLKKQLANAQKDAVAVPGWFIGHEECTATHWGALPQPPKEKS